MEQLKIKNGVNTLTVSEQKTILSAQYYKITVNGSTFAGLVLYISGQTVFWEPADIDAAIIYCKKNNLIQIHS